MPISRQLRGMRVPTGSKVPLPRWSNSELATQPSFGAGWRRSHPRRCAACWPRSRSSVAAPALIFPCDPHCILNAARVLDLYDRRWQGVALRQDQFVISPHEKSQLQALAPPTP